MQRSGWRWSRHRCWGEQADPGGAAGGGRQVGVTGHPLGRMEQARCAAGAQFGDMDLRWRCAERPDLLRRDRARTYAVPGGQQAHQAVAARQGDDAGDRHPDASREQLSHRARYAAVYRGGMEPMAFAGQPGIRFTYSFTRPNEDLPRKGEGRAAMIGGKLYLITFEAPRLHISTPGWRRSDRWRTAPSCRTPDTKRPVASPPRPLFRRMVRTYFERSTCSKSSSTGVARPKIDTDTLTLDLSKSSSSTTVEAGEGAFQHLDRIADLVVDLDLVLRGGGGLFLGIQHPRRFGFADRLGLAHRAQEAGDLRRVLDEVIDLVGHVELGQHVTRA